MKHIFNKNWSYIGILLLFVTYTSTATASDLHVAGITYPITANGTYIEQTDLYSYKSWKLINGGNIYYIYNDDYNGERYWNIDDDTDDMNDAFFICSVPTAAASPVGITDWFVFNGGIGTPVITEAAAPLVNEIVLKGNGLEIVSGDITPTFTDHTKFGSVNVSSGTTSRTYTIQNLGGAPLSISNVSLSGVNAADFSISTSPSATVASAGSTVFTIDFNPSAIGERKAIVTITNNDLDEGSTTFWIHGYGFTPSNLTVSGISTPAAANGLYIHQGVLNNFEYWKHETQNYYLFNQNQIPGGRFWNIDANLIDTDNDFQFYISSENFTPISLTGWTNNSNIGNVSTGTPFITAGAPIPEIDIKANTASIADESATATFDNYTNFGAIDVQTTGNRTRTFTIENSGNANLTLSGSPLVTISGVDAADFYVSAQPGSTTISSNNTTTFEISFDPTTIGTKTAIVTLNTNDRDEAVYNFKIQGDAVSPKDINVTGITTPSEANGTYVYQGLIYEMPYWKHATINYYIYNDQYRTVGRFWNIDTDLLDNDDAYFQSKSEKTFPSSIEWTIETTGAGNPIITVSEPEIRVEGNAVEIVNGDNTPSISDKTNFGEQVVSSSFVDITFTIKNTGSGSLYLTGNPLVSISGTHASDFTITSQPSSSTLTPAGNTQFVVRFAPTTTGVRNAIVSIANTDADESSYNFSIQGNGVVKAAVTTQTVSNITTTTATGNGNVTYLGVPNPTQFGMVWNTSTNPTVALSTKTTQGAKSTTGAFTSSITGLSANTTYYVRAYATNSVGTNYGAEVSFKTNLETNLSYTTLNTLSIYPNPTVSGFTIDLRENTTTVSIYDLSGALVLTQQAMGKTEINISSLQQGVYIVKVNGLVAKLLKK
ncbi:MAG: choice-of-anchor D domain-containing protein [Paludibacter sp.]|nr:choice-of-anchor D domain-containing protein [Paludibacter sp.]